MSENTTCKFCGQIRIDGVRCDCNEAKAEVRRENYLERAREEIDKLLGADIDEEITERIKETAEYISYGKLNVAKFTTANNVTVTVKKVADGAIKIERSESIKNSSIVTELG